MARKRTTVFADEEDLAVLREAARLRGVPEAELVREAIHTAAQAHRTWDQPLFTRTCTPPGSSPRRAGEVLEQVWDEQADVYERGRRST